MFTCPQCNTETNKLVVIHKVGLGCYNCKQQRSTNFLTEGHNQSNNPYVKMTQIEENHLKSRRGGADGMVHYPERYKTSSHQ